MNNTYRFLAIDREELHVVLWSHIPLLRKLLRVRESIEETAQQFGFGDYRWFRRIFKRRHGASGRSCIEIFICAAINRKK